jgi:hypothetical protein
MKELVMAGRTTGREQPIDRRTRTVLWFSLAAGVSFVPFAWVTTQVKSVRAAGPWQDDPYDVVVSFTEFLVPALLCLIASRMLLWRGGEPQPMFRMVQLLRASTVCALFVTATAVADWTAVVLRADRAAWAWPTTPALACGLAALTAGAVASVAIQRKVLRRLPSERARDGDWLDDLALLPARLTGRESARRPRCRTAMIAVVRRRFAAVAALAAALAVTLAQAVGEGWTDPLLFGFGVLVGAGGFFGMAILCNRYLVIATQPPVTGRVRRACRAAGVAAALGLPATVAVRGEVLHLIGAGADDSPGFLLLLAITGAAAAAVIAFAVAFARREPVG